MTLRHGGVHAGTMGALALRPGAMTRVPWLRSSDDGVSARQHWRLPVMDDDNEGGRQSSGHELSFQFGASRLSSTIRPPQSGQMSSERPVRRA